MSRASAKGRRLPPAIQEQIRGLLRQGGTQAAIRRWIIGKYPDTGLSLLSREVKRLYDELTKIIDFQGLPPNKRFNARSFFDCSEDVKSIRLSFIMSLSIPKFGVITPRKYAVTVPITATPRGMVEKAMDEIARHIRQRYSAPSASIRNIRNWMKDIELYTAKCI